MWHMLQFPGRIVVGRSFFNIYDYGKFVNFFYRFWYILTKTSPCINSEKEKCKTSHIKKCSLYRPGVAQRVGRSIALLFNDRGTRRGWVVSSTPRPHFTPEKDPVPILQEASWAPGPVWTGGKSRPHRDSIKDRPVRSFSLYRLSYPAHKISHTNVKMKFQSASKLTWISEHFVCRVVFSQTCS